MSPTYVFRSSDGESFEEFHEFTKSPKTIRRNGKMFTRQMGIPKLVNVKDADPLAWLQKENARAMRNGNWRDNTHD